MKRLFIFGILSLAALALLITHLPPSEHVLAQAAPTATTRPTRVRPPKVTPTPEPTETAEPDENNADAELAPVAPGAMTSQIVVFNPDTSGSATVQIDIYNSAGAVAYTTTEFISANGAKIITLPNSLGANFQGSAVISSDKNVQALALTANGNNNARDAYEGTSAPAPNLVIPFARHLANDTQNSILAVQNTTASNADVTLTFYNADGTQAHQQNTTVAANQPLYLNTDDIFSGSHFTGTVGITSTQHIVAALQTRYLKDTAAVRALTKSEQDRIVYLNPVERKLNDKGVPQTWTEIFVRNNGANATDITLEFFKNDGTLSGTQTATAVPANGMAQFLLNDAAFASLGNAFAGWAKATSSGEPLGVSALSVLNKGKRLTGADGLANSQLNTRYMCGNTARSATENTQLTLLNTEARNAKVMVRLFDPNTGAKLAQATFKLTPNAATTVKLSDALFAGAGSDFRGMTLVQAKGTTPPKIIAAVSNPYGSSKLTGTTGYLCSALP
jgi:hypothetical protein